MNSDINDLWEKMAVLRKLVCYMEFEYGGFARNGGYAFGDTINGMPKFDETAAESIYDDLLKQVSSCREDIRRLEKKT